MTLVRSQLTRNIDVMFPDIKDEIITSFDDVLNLSGNGEERSEARMPYADSGTRRVEARACIGCHGTGRLQSEQQGVCRSSIMCAFPSVVLSFLTLITLGRHPDWINLNIVHTMDTIKGGIIAGFFPDFIRP